VVTVSVCLCALLSVRDHIFGTTRPIFTKLLCIVPMAVARSSSDAVAIRYVLPVSWMTSYLLITKAARRRRSAEAQLAHMQPRPSGKWRAVIPIAGQQTHGPTFRALKVTSQVATPGAESAFCDCFVTL